MAIKKDITVAAVLAYKWYDAILAGKKKTEYRDISDYWVKRLWATAVRGRIGAITFQRGYTSVKATFEVLDITVNRTEGLFEIHLGNRIG